jgi:hypothetical protein
VQLVLGGGIQQPGTGAVERQSLRVLGGQRLGQAFQQLLHEDAAGDRVLAFDVRAQLRR